MQTVKQYFDTCGNAPAVAEILAILDTKCTFKDSWDDLDDPCVMRVFGKRKTEQKEFDSHIQRVRASESSYRILKPGMRSVFRRGQCGMRQTLDK